MGKALMMLWHTRDEKPKANSTIFVDDGDAIYLDKIGDNFDEWGDSVLRWGYWIGDDKNEKDTGDCITDNTININIFSDHTKPTFRTDWDYIVKQFEKYIEDSNKSRNPKKRECNPNGTICSDETHFGTRITRMCSPTILRECKRLLKRAYEGEFILYSEDINRIYYILACRRDRKEINIDSLVKGVRG